MEDTIQHQPVAYLADRDFALQMDRDDPLAELRGEYHIPKTVEGEEFIYLCGNSLGLQPKGTRAAIEQELKDWAELGVDGHFESKHPWYSYHEAFREPAARLVGALPGEVVVMNTLTTNLHLMMVSFYRPTRERYRVLIEENAFPSDLYAVRSQAAFHGYDPDDAVMLLRPRHGEDAVRTRTSRSFCNATATPLRW
ncbi:MAG: Kynureninase [Chlorobi bacterium OLB7]|nr:MAG: Kynureninase [Chlorobi bacterium OLB7]